MTHTPLPRFLYGSLPIAVLLLGASFILSRDTTAASTLQPVTGWAWSAGTDKTSGVSQPFMGWISFSPNNPGSGGGNYGVFENTTTGELSGYAWSTNLGRISFNETSGCPSGGTCTPKVDLLTGTGRLSGWARACSAFQAGCSGVLDQNSGGWDGWISLSGTAQDGSAYGVTQSATGAWTGYAWGSDAIGAINMGAGTTATGETYPGVTGPTTATPIIDVTLTADNYLVNPGDRTMLHWTSTGGATSCTFLNNALPGGGAIGDVLTEPIYTPTGYTVECVGPNGPPKQSPPISINVANPAINFLTATPDRVASGERTTVAWKVENAQSCTLKRNGVLIRTLRIPADFDSFTDDTVTVQTTYVLTCGTVSATKVVNILPSFIEF